MGEKLWPRVTAALFGPNKKISEESIAYFLSVNSFMMVKASMGYFLDSLCCLIFCPPPIELLEEGKRAKERGNEISLATTVHGGGFS